MAPTFDREALEQRLHVKLADWRGLLTRNGRHRERYASHAPGRADPVHTGA
jgi:hypothetical protein